MYFKTWFFVNILYIIFIDILIFKKMETFSELKENWLELFKVSPSKLAEMSQVDGVITGFNVNIDAVIKIKGEIFA